MEVQIDTLIEKVRQHGIVEGEKKAEEIQDEAQRKADALVASAKEEARSIIAEAQVHAEALEKRGKDALSQAHRDLLLTIKEDIRQLLSRFISQEMRGVLSGASLQGVLEQVLSKWSFGKDENVFISLSESDVKNIIHESLHGALQAQGATITLQSHASISGGFRIARKSDGALQFDFTDETLSQSLVSFLTPKLQELLK